MEQTDLTYRLGVAILVGLLIGLQREHEHDHEKQQESLLFAGARTFALFAIVGFLAAFVADVFTSPLGFLTIFGAAMALIVTSYAISASKGRMGLTTEASAIITLLIGSLCFWNELIIAAAIGVLTATLLTLKVRMQTLVRSLTREDVYATLKFAFISIIVLPLLPRQALWPAPFDVIVPFNLWLMVVFISGIGFLGYFLIKVVGVKKGVGLTGLLGGLASSTAVTMSFSQRSRNWDSFAHPFALAILISWTVMIVRVAVEVVAINVSLMQILWPSLTIVVVLCLVYSAYLYLAQSTESSESTEQFTNPFELRPALVFGLLYAAVLLITNFAQLRYGDAGIYVSSILSGLVDVDAITLTMARLSRDGGSLEHTTAARAIVLAVVANTIVKGGIVLFTGSPGLRRVIVPGILLITASAIASIFLLT